MKYRNIPWLDVYKEVTGIARRLHSKKLHNYVKKKQTQALDIRSNDKV